MKIVRVVDKELADKCDEMLTALIMDERKYDTNIKKDFVVNGWYCTTLSDKNRATFAAVEGEKAVGFIHGFLNDNCKAIELYEKLGFIPVKTYMRSKLE